MQVILSSRKVVQKKVVEPKAKIVFPEPTPLAIQEEGAEESQDLSSTDDFSNTFFFQFH